MKKYIPYVFAAVMLVALSAGGYYFQKNKIVALNPPPTGEVPASVVATPTPNASYDPSVIGEESTTTAVFVGYYGTRLWPAHEGTPAQTCSIFVVQKSDDPLFTYLTDIVRQGSTLNALDADGNLLLNIDLDAVTVDIKSTVMASTKLKNVPLTVQKKALIGKGANACFSVVNILSTQ